MIGEKIKELRTKSGMTQKELAEKLYVTPQALSRWENNEVEPSIGTITKLAEIFQISTDTLLDTGIENPEKITDESTDVKDVKEEQASIPEQKEIAIPIALCESCNHPIYKSEDIVRKSYYLNRHSQTRVICRTCDEKQKKAEMEQSIQVSHQSRKRALVLGILATVICIVIGIVHGVSNHSVSNTFIWIGIGVFAFCFISCLLLKNNFIGEMTSSIMEWGFVKMPGVIFELDLDGIIWLLTVKLLFWILEIILAIATGILGIVIGSVMSVFVCPFAYRKSIVHPEETDLID